MKRYPTKQDIEKHSKQLLGSLRGYILGYDNKANFVNNALRCLFTDLLLEVSNLGMNWKNGSFPDLIKLLSKKKFIPKR